MWHYQQPAGLGTLTMASALQINHHFTAYYDSVFNLAIRYAVFAQSTVTFFYLFVLSLSLKAETIPYHTFFSWSIMLHHVCFFCKLWCTFCKMHFCLSTANLYLLKCNILRFSNRHQICYVYYYKHLHYMAYCSPYINEYCMNTSTSHMILSSHFILV